MYEIRQGTRTVAGQEITTYKREIVQANILEVEAGTNGYKGGDSGHGSRTYFSISDLGSTDITVNSWDGGLAVCLGGDCELDTIITALKFIVEVLEDQADEYGHCV